MLPSHCHLFWLLKLANSVPPSAHYHLETEEVTAALSCAVTLQFSHAQSYQPELSYLVTEASRAYSTMPGGPSLGNTWV